MKDGRSSDEMGGNERYVADQISVRDVNYTFVGYLIN
jgi:hypothetical protein